MCQFSSLTSIVHFCLHYSIVSYTCLLSHIHSDISSVILCLHVKNLLAQSLVQGVPARGQLTALPVVKLMMPFHPYFVKTEVVIGALY